MRLDNYPGDQKHINRVTKTAAVLGMPPFSFPLAKTKNAT